MRGDFDEDELEVDVDRPKPQAKRLRERCTMNILTVEEPYPGVTKKIVRQLLSALEAAERYIASVPIEDGLFIPEPSREPKPLCVCGHGWALHVIPGGVDNIDIYPTERWCVDCACRNYRRSEQTIEAKS